MFDTSKPKDVKELIGSISRYYDIKEETTFEADVWYNSMIEDVTDSAKNSGKKTLPENIQKAVLSMIDAVREGNQSKLYQIMRDNAGIKDPQRVMHQVMSRGNYRGEGLDKGWESALDIIGGMYSKINDNVVSKLKELDPSFKPKKGYTIPASPDS